MKTKLNILLVVVAFLAVMPGLRAAGEYREVSAFSEITLRIPANLYILQGKEQSLEIVAEESVVNKIITDVKGRELTIRSSGLRNISASSIEVFITIPDIDALAVSGSGNILSNGAIQSRILKLAVSGSGKIGIEKLSAERVMASLSGSGDIALTGVSDADELTLNISGSGKFDGLNFPVNNVNVRISGSGDALVYAHDMLKVFTVGSGDVIFRGNAATDQSVVGSGKVEAYRER
ncbi:MAG: head GIN domain-containing protein [Mangrovibacterium sp.]